MTRQQPPASFAGDTRYQRLLLGIAMVAVTAFGSLMTLVTVALGEIGDDLGASRATMTWTITGLMLVIAVATPLAGTLGDVHGHRKVLLAGLALGAVATLLCGLAWDAASLIGFRVLFGLAGAAVNPNVMALMMHAYGPERRATAVGWFQFAMTGAPTIGLVVGGPLIDLAGWRAIFFIFAAISAVGFMAGVAWLRPIPRQQGRPLDVGGATTLGLGVFAALMAITRITSTLQDGGVGQLMADPIAIGTVLITAAGLAAFVSVERRVEVPMLKLEYFRRRNFVLPLASAAGVQFAYMGGFVITPALLEEHYGWTVGAIALLMMPRPGVFSLASPLGGWLPSRVGYRLPIMLGAIVMIASMAVFAAASLMTSGLGIALIVVGLSLSGLASGISQPAVAALAVDSVDEADVGVANGMNQQTMFVGIVAGIQTMNVLVGDGAGGTRFMVTFLVGLGFAVVGLICATFIRHQGR